MAGGPGEFEDPKGLLRFGDLLATRDFGDDRLSLWTWTGEPAGTRNLETLPLRGSAVWIAPVDTGRLAATTFVPIPSEGPIAALPRALVVASTSGELDTLADVSIPGFQVVRAEGRTRQLPLPYTPVPVAAVSAGLVYVARGAGYDVIGFGTTGDTVRRLTGPAERPPVTAGMKRAFASGIGDSAFAARIEYPKRAPVVRSLVAGPGGELLVRTWWRTGDLDRWDRWSGQGVYSGSFLLPTGAAHVAVGVGRIVARTEDALDRQRVTVFTPSDSASCPGPVPDPARAPMAPPPERAP